MHARIYMITHRGLKKTENPNQTAEPNWTTLIKTKTIIVGSRTELLFQTQFTYLNQIQKTEPKMGEPNC
jgi:hypothetical protein